MYLKCETRDIYRIREVKQDRNCSLLENDQALWTLCIYTVAIRRRSVGVEGVMITQKAVNDPTVEDDAIVLSRSPASQTRVMTTLLSWTLSVPYCR